MLKPSFIFFIIFFISNVSQALVSMETKEYTEQWYELMDVISTRSYNKNSNGVFGKNQCSVFDMSGLCSFKTLDKKYLEKNKLSFNVEKGKVTSFSSQGRFFRLRYEFNKVSEILSEKNDIVASFKYKNDLLVSVKNEWGNTYSYEYLDNGLLFKTTYPDNKYTEITYNQNKEVISFLDKDKCLEKYFYSNSILLDKTDSNAKTYDKSEVLKTCKNEFSLKNIFDFWKDENSLKHVYEIWKDKNNQITRVKVDKNGEISDISYENNKPVEVFKNNQYFKYSYYKNGLLKTKEFENKKSTYFYNKNDFVEKIIVFDLVSKQEKAMAFKYNGKNLTKIFALDNSVLDISYNSKNLITEFLSSSGEHILISYEKNFNKPEKIELKNVGSILINYNSNGEISNVNGTLNDPVVKKILLTLDNFSNYLHLSEM